MLDPTQFKVLVIRPTLVKLGLWSVAAENLLLGTALAESSLVYLEQLDGGPALGLYQCEPVTHDDVWRWLDHHEPYGGRVAALVPDSLIGLLCRQLLTNLAYATAICRIHYWRVPEPLPPARNAATLASYHKRYYNTVLGAADPVQTVVHFQRAIAA
jgi:hypothetical protein